MRLIAFLVFVAVPLAELALLIKVGEIIGVLPTVLLVIVTAMLGVTLLRIQGLTVLANARASIEAGRAPVDSVVDGVLLLVAGAFLLTPGLITDSLGFLLLIPDLRRSIAHFALTRLIRLETADMRGYPPGSGPAGGPRGPGRQTPRRPGGGPTIEGEYSRVEEEDEKDRAERAEEGAGGEPGRGGGGRSPWRK